MPLKIQRRLRLPRGIRPFHLVPLVIIVVVALRSVTRQLPAFDEFDSGYGSYDKIEKSPELLVDSAGDLFDFGNWQDDITPEFLLSMDKKTKHCPNYKDYSSVRHGPFSKGHYKYPYMRPPPKCRTFVSPALEKLIDDLKSKVKSPDLARLIENTLPNTLDTTILWHKASKDSSLESPQTFVVTGDIHAEWLRDSAHQLSVFMPLLKYDSGLKELVKGAIKTQEQYIRIAPYCNAFHPPPESGVKKGNTAMDQVFPRPDWHYVFECKYEIDSLASFLTLTNDYLENTGDDSIISKSWFQAYERVLTVIYRESQPLFDGESGAANSFYYSFKRQTDIGSETLPLGGVGNPVNFNTGLVRSAFRPSDDATILQFFIPGNAQLAVELLRTIDNIFKKELLKGPDIEKFYAFTNTCIDNIRAGINKYGVIDHPKWGKVYAYEVDGYGGCIFMDDANIPSLLSFPDFGFTTLDDPIYQNTRKMILSKEGNPYFLKGSRFQGIGGPHIGIVNAWPMSLLLRMRTTDDDAEIEAALNQIMDSTGGLGLMHESVNVNAPHGNVYTRQWFAWCNSEFGKTILHLAQHKPHLIFGQDFAGKAYNIEEVFS